METKTNIFGIPFDIIVALLQGVTEIIKLFTPNHVSAFQQTKQNNQLNQTL